MVSFSFSSEGFRLLRNMSWAPIAFWFSRWKCFGQWFGIGNRIGIVSKGIYKYIGGVGEIEGSNFRAGEGGVKVSWQIVSCKERVSKQFDGGPMKQFPYILTRTSWSSRSCWDQNFSCVGQLSSLWTARKKGWVMGPLGMGCFSLPNLVEIEGATASNLNSTPSFP